jgi:hypothetical protein
VAIELYVERKNKLLPRQDKHVHGASTELECFGLELPSRKCAQSPAVIIDDG